MALTLIHEVKEVLLGWTEGFHASTRRVGIRVEWPEGPECASEQTAATNTVNASAPTWLTSVVGAFDNDPLYPQILENERQARLMDEQFITLE